MGLSCAGAAGGVWTTQSKSFPARFLRDRFAEIGREIAKPKFKPDPGTWDDNAITATWLGHATVLLNFYGLKILTDPVLSDHIGADLGIGTLGPKRLIAAALDVKELQEVDLVLLSHAHLDHMDFPTLKKMKDGARAITARQTSDLLAGAKMPVAAELGWGDKTIFKSKNGDAEIEAFEVRHWGGRWSRKEKRGWNGYIISRNGKKIIFGGDTANCENFKNLRSKGPFELALMPIGSYNPWIMAHCTPEESVEMSNAAGAKYILPIHHQAFVLSREPVKEPIERFEAAMQKESERIALREVGETFSIS